jgi:hypothetical protein
MLDFKMPIREQPGPRPWENASEVWVDAPCFPGVRADADRQTDASSLSEAIRF